MRIIDPELPAHLGKEAFHPTEQAQPELFPYALAAGFRTTRMNKVESHNGWQIAMRCCRAVAEGVTTGQGDQVHSYSEISDSPVIVSLSGMSGGPAFWSDGTARGLIGIVKQTMSHEEGVDTLGGGPRVHFICRHFSAEEFARWTTELQPA
jgi:hypothetical protein